MAKWRDKKYKRERSHDGSVVVGGPAPNWTQSEQTNSISSGTNSCTKTYGLKQVPPWVHRQNAELNQNLKEHVKNLVNQEKQILEDLRYIDNFKRKKKRSPQKTQSCLSDEQVIYLRKQIRTRSMKSLIDELGFSKPTISNAIRGITHKHLNSIEKPQF